MKTATIAVGIDILGIVFIINSSSVVRIWSLHPRYLDRQGLVALRRESLLARTVLLGDGDVPTDMPTSVPPRTDTTEGRLRFEWMHLVEKLEWGAGVD